jgi:hypothetical protein
VKLLFITAIVFPVVVLAQVGPRPVLPSRSSLPPVQMQGAYESLPDNYQLTLVMTDKDGQPLELSVVVASSQFNATIGEQGLNFSGSVTVEETGTIRVAYALGWQTTVASGNNSVQYQTSSAQGSVRLKPEEEVQILRAGSRIARLSIKKIESTKTK